MFNWFDLMQQAQTNSAYHALTRQFQLSTDQSQKAMAAFLPAFAMGLQHAMTGNDPNRLLQSMVTDGYQTFWRAAGMTFSAQAQQQGRRILDQLFGSDEVSRRVAHQAADYAGVSVDTMQQLLPVLAGILAGGMSHLATTQAQAMQNLASPQEPAKSQAASSNPWAEFWGAWMKGAAEQKPAANPFEEMMSAFLKVPPAPEPPAPEPAPKEPPPSSPSWNDMMEQGREMQMQYLTSLQSIFEDAWKAGPKKP